MLRLSSTVFLATACLLLNAGVSSFKMTTCGPHVHRLTCESGVINVENTFFGRKDETTCAGGKSKEEISNTECSLESALELVTKRCNGKKWCELTENCFESDPCNGTFKYIQTSYTCVPATHVIVCEHSLAHLDCDDGKVINVIGADFGRRDHTTCAYKRDPSRLQRIDCTRPTNWVAEKCNGKNTCTFRASESVLNESCAETALYLEMSYTCQAPQ